MAGSIPLHAARDGRQHRKVVQRSSHGHWRLLTAADRDPVVILQDQATTRVPDLVPIRYGRMLQSSFAHYRGAAAIMAHDLARSPATGLIVQLCGDAHLANFGGFSAPDRALVFDLNDFDETLPGPFEWDLKRLAASFAVAGRSRGFTPGQRATIVRATVRAYQQAMAEFASMARLHVWYARLAGAEIMSRWGKSADKQSIAAMRRLVAKAGQRTGERAFSRYSRIDVDGQLQPVSEPPLLVPLGELFEGDWLQAAVDVISQSMAAYIKSLPGDRQVLVNGYELVGFSRKVVGVGSVGTRCWIALLVAKDDRLDDLVLQVKEAGPSVLEPYLKTSEFGNHGQRVVEGQRLMQAASDTLLGWERSAGFGGEPHDYYVRQMWDGKVSADPMKMTRKGYAAYAEMCGWTLARAHARSGDRKAIAEYLGSGEAFSRALADFAEGYADQNEADFALLGEAAAAGRVPVAAG